MSRLIGAAVVGLLVSSMAQQRPTFRAGIDVVTLDVSVFSGNKPVPGLGRGDFRVTDNGVRQDIDVLQGSSLPIDVTLVLDLSGSMWLVRANLRRTAEAATEALRGDDRIRLLQAGSGLEAGPFQSVSTMPAFPEVQPLAGTSIIDGLAAALLTPPDQDRRHLVMAVSDGWDTMGALSFDRLRDVSRSTDAVLEMFVLWAKDGEDPAEAPRPSKLDTRNRWLPGLGTSTDWSYEEVASATGGDCWPAIGSAALPDGFRERIDAFRAGYVIRYTAKGVASAGWHDVSVTVPGRNAYRVAVRKGYPGS